MLAFHELGKKKNDLWNADNEYVAGKLNVKVKQNKVLELRLTKNLVGFVQLFPLFQTKSGAFYYSVAELIENLTPC